MDLPKRPPAPYRQAGNQKARDHEERDDGIVARPEQNLIEDFRQHPVDVVMVDDKPQMNVVHDDQQHTQSTQNINAVQSGAPRFFV